MLRGALPVFTTTASLPEGRFLGQAVGHVHDRLEHWEHVLKADSFVMGVLKEGYKIPVEVPEVPYREPNNASANRHLEFVRAEVKKLLDSGRVVRCKDPPEFAIRLLWRQRHCRTAL